jgi:hypothetical protein
MTPNQLDLLWRFLFLAVACTGIGFWAGYWWQQTEDRHD